MPKKIIYADDAIDAICKACSMEGDYHKCNGYPETSTWCDELVALRAVPSAQPKRIKGRWIPFDIPWYQCSECGAVRENNAFMENFCPNCGADMRGEQDG